MDPLLADCLKLACCVRDCEEAAAWRRAWASMNSYFWNKRDGDPLLDDPFFERMNIILSTDTAQARPLVFPLLLSEFSGLTLPQIKTKILGYPVIWNSYRYLDTCTQFIVSVVDSLRRAAPGYPHSDLIYTTPYAPWASPRDNLSQVPFTSQSLSATRENVRDPLGTSIAETVLAKPNIGALVNKPARSHGTNQTAVDIGRFVPSAAPELARHMDNLLMSIKMSIPWKQLTRAYESAEHLKNYTKQMRQARAQFEDQYGKLKQDAASGHVSGPEATRLAEKVYSRQARQVAEYARSFIDYELALERIYWLISHLVINETISCLSSAKPQQIQQINFHLDKEDRLSAVAPTSAKGQEVGRLIHITLPEVGSYMDGIYQVEQHNFHYTVESGACFLFMARRLWEAELSSIIQSTAQFKAPVFAPSDEQPARDLIDSAWISIGPNPDIRVREMIPALSMSKTMYFP